MNFDAVGSPGKEINYYDAEFLSNSGPCWKKLMGQSVRSRWTVCRHTPINKYKILNSENNIYNPSYK